MIRCYLKVALAVAKFLKKIATEIQLILQQRVPEIQLQHYIDNFIVKAENEKDCETHLHELLHDFWELGVPMAPDKTTEPSTVITFLCQKILNCWLGYFHLKNMQKHVGFHYR